MKKKKPILVPIIFTVFLFLILSFIVVFVDPNTFAIIPLFFFILFVALFFTFSLIFKNKKRGLIVGSAITIFFVMRYFGMGNFLNFFLLAGITTTILAYEYYTQKPN